jgi:hypothetical protein
MSSAGAGSADNPNNFQFFLPCDGHEFVIDLHSMSQAEAKEMVLYYLYAHNLDNAIEYAKLALSWGCKDAKKLLEDLVEDNPDDKEDEVDSCDQHNDEDFFKLRLHV